MITTMIDHAKADFWIAPAETKSFEGSSLLAGRERFQALSIDGVAEVVPVVVGYASWRNPKGGASMPVFLVGSPSARPRAALRPWNVVEGSLDDLSMPDAVAIDRSYFEQLGSVRSAATAEIGNQKARVVAITKGIRSFTTTPNSSPRSIGRAPISACRRTRPTISWCGSRRTRTSPRFAAASRPACPTPRC